MSKTRMGEDQAFPFRTGRVFAANHEWFFAVRDGKPVGPFRSEKEARLALTVYVATRLIESSEALERFVEEVGPRSADHAMIAEAATFQLKWHEHGLPKALNWLKDRVLFLENPHGLVDHQTERLAILDFLERNHVWEDHLYRGEISYPLTDTTD
jgi:hypothetical protein